VAVLEQATTTDAEVIALAIGEAIHEPPSVRFHET
jgi:hypothetical protein